MKLSFIIFIRDRLSERHELFTKQVLCLVPVAATTKFIKFSLSALTLNKHSFALLSLA
jgi:hypothetical protein